MFLVRQKHSVRCLVCSYICKNKLSYLPIGLPDVKKFLSAQFFPLSRAIVVSVLCLISLIFAFNLANEQPLRRGCLSCLIYFVVCAK